MKWVRNYRITVDDFETGQSTIIEPPFSIRFSINRSAMSSLNSMNLQITNLAERTRNAIFKDRFTNVYRKVTVEAGYGDQLFLIFSGDIFEANSTRQGTEFITSINARDGGFDTATTKSFVTLEKGTKYQDFLKRLMAEFPNLSPGAVGDFEGEFRRPVVVDGNTFEIIKKYSDGKVFIDLGKINTIKDNEVLEGDVPLINADTGLLETPRRDESYLTITTLFEPRIFMGQVVEIDSKILPVYNGQYKVIGVTHEGIISEAVGGQCQSTFNLLVGSQLFGAFKTV